SIITRNFGQNMNGQERMDVMGEPAKTVVFEIERRDRPEEDSYWEKFELPYRMNMNVISALMEVRRNPINIDGERTTPVSWDMNCLEEVCGACSMVINGKARQACTAL